MRPRQGRALAAVFVVCLAVSACGGSPISPDPGGGGGGGGSGPPPFPNNNVLVGAGDIAQCGSPGSEQTARLIDTIPGTVFTAGDNAYPFGAVKDFQECYSPTWGRFRDRTRPTPGNHDYLTAGASGYFQYFGPNAGPSGLGYYSYTVSTWKILALNSEIFDAGPRAAQLSWLQSELAANPGQCTLAIWHRPLYTSGPNGENQDMRDVFRILYTANVDVVLNGHDHLYERFAPQDADGHADALKGIREFVVGTGGYDLYDPGTRRPNSEVVLKAYGVLKLTLNPGSYEWEFIPSTPGVRDTGTGTCH